MVFYLAMRRQGIPYYLTIRRDGAIKLYSSEYFCTEKSIFLIAGNSLTEKVENGFNLNSGKIKSVTFIAAK
jgi:hypothetical protein